MSIEFAENIISSMVDENGHCGERGLSVKQFDCLAQHLTCQGMKNAGEWHGTRGGRRVFTDTDYSGNIGRYAVTLNEYWHFNRRCTVVEINLRPAEEVEFERKMKELEKFEHSAHLYEEKQRIDIELTLVSVYEFERERYTYGYETAYIYKLADNEGNCYVWKTTNVLSQEVESADGEISFIYADKGDTVKMRGTVKENGEYKGVKQTVLTRCKVNEVVKR